MDKIRHIEQSLLRSRRALFLLIGVVLAAVVSLTTLQMRQKIRQQIAGRDGEVLYAVALMHYADDLEEGLLDPVADPADQLSVVLKSSQIRGVLGIRLFDPGGQYLGSFPSYVRPGASLGPGLAELKNFRPVSQFHPEMKTWALFQPDKGEEQGVMPVLEVSVPLHAQGGPLAGIAQFVVEGHSIASEYSRLDQRLTIQAVIAVGSGGAILTLALGWAFRRLRRAHRLVAERTENLVRANQELALAAKTSALGVVTAHLIHGLKNPLAGLQSYVSSRGTPGGSEESDWQQAVLTTRRMQAMVDQVVGVLREEQAGAGYSITTCELMAMVRARVEPAARQRGVEISTRIERDGLLTNRVANLVGLILVNLAENAVQASAPGKAIRLSIRPGATRLLFEVQDNSAGFPADLPLFQPCPSRKEGGTGIGLALSKQLANHLGAELELSQNSPEGCVFTLRLPLSVIETEPTFDSDPMPHLTGGIGARSSSVPGL